MIVSGTFKCLFYPAEDVEQDLPASVVEGGISDLSVIPFNGTLTHRPYFEGAGLSDVVPFLTAIETYLTEILKKIGVESAEEQSIVKTGKARRYDFEKTKAYIVSGIKQCEKTEKTIYKFCKKWEGEKSISKPNVTYYREFLDEDFEYKMQKFINLLSLPYDSLKKAVHKLMVKNSLTTELDKTELKKIINEIDSAKTSIEQSGEKADQLYNELKTIEGGSNVE
jgi:hypothetical protein